MYNYEWSNEEDIKVYKNKEEILITKRSINNITNNNIGIKVKFIKIYL
jgi:hypothetical protein